MVDSEYGKIFSNYGDIKYDKNIRKDVRKEFRNHRVNNIYIYKASLANWEMSISFHVLTQIMVT